MSLSLVTRRGFTLLEVTVTMVLLGLVSAAVYRVLLTQQRLTQLQVERMSLQANLRAGLGLLTAELQEIAVDSAGSDLQALGPDSITYRAMRTTAFACEVSGTNVRISARSFGYRRPQAGRDSLLLFVEGDSTIATDDRWVAAPITAVSSGTACAGRPAVDLATAIDLTAVPLTTIQLDAPIRTFEVMQLKLYSSGGRHWLGARSLSAGEIIQPVLGPLTATGLTLTYADSAGAPTGDPRRVRSIAVSLHAVTDRLVRSGAAEGPLALAQDSGVALVTLRNAPTF
ncbi:MAG: PulJ/GspJ family protein [Gemmatimonadales bacterium]